MVTTAGAVINLPPFVNDFSTDFEFASAAPLLDIPPGTYTLSGLAERSIQTPFCYHSLSEQEWFFVRLRVFSIDQGDLDGNGSVDGADLETLLGAFGPCPTPVCGAGAGDCLAANGTPGCDLTACCELVCGLDQFCCDVDWDQACADQAGELCSDCCLNNGTPGCDDTACESAVCLIDEFCCNSTWDNLCADEAADLCPGLCGDEAGDCLGDLNDDGVVDGADLGILLGSWTG